MATNEKENKTGKFFLNCTSRNLVFYEPWNEVNVEMLMQMYRKYYIQSIP